MWIAMQGEVLKVIKRLFAALLAHCLFPDIAPQPLGHFDVEELGSM